MTINYVRRVAAAYVRELEDAGEPDMAKKAMFLLEFIDYMRSDVEKQKHE